MTNNTLPNTFLIGVAKSGTTALTKIIINHPDIFIPKNKEINFFIKKSNLSIFQFFGFRNIYSESLHYSTNKNGWEWYKNQFQTTKRITIDGSILYFNEPNSILQIKKYYPNSQLIIMLRDPVYRLYSHYFHEISLGLNIKNHNSFNNLLNNNHPRLKYYSKISHYKQHIEFILKHFNKNQIHFIIFNDFKIRKQETLNSLFNFLSVPEINLSHYDKPYNQHHVITNNRLEFIRILLIKNYFFKLLPNYLKNNIFKIKRLFYNTFNLNSMIINYPPLDPEIRKRLIPEFMEDIEYVEKLLGRDLSHWKK